MTNIDGQEVSEYTKDFAIEAWNSRVPIDLRDRFAAAATDADVKYFMYEDNNGSLIPLRNRVQARYAFADAMLKARK